MNITQWLEANTAKQDKKPYDGTLTAFLTKSIERSVGDEEEAYAEAIHARTMEEKTAAIQTIIDNRKANLAKKTEDDKEPRKKGWLELKFDTLCLAHEIHPTEVGVGQLMGLISQMEVNRRVRFFYDLQKLRIGSSNRKEIYEQEFGVKDMFIEYAGDQLGRMEKLNEKMVDSILLRSPYKQFYTHLRDTYLGVGVMMAGCIISELSTPERFRSVSSLWAYCGLAVVGNDPETGHGGHAQRRTVGETANWNSFLKTKLIGVMASCMIKAQTKHIDTPEEKTKGQNVKVLNDYKCRLATQNDLIAEGFRVYDRKGKEVFSYQTAKEILWYDKDGNSRGSVAPNQIKRRGKAHINKMATRYMVKMFLTEILNVWRGMEGLEPFLSYDEAKLRGGRAHGA